MQRRERGRKGREGERGTARGEREGEERGKTQVGTHTYPSVLAGGVVCPNPRLPNQPASTTGAWTGQGRAEGRGRKTHIV